MRLVTAGMRSPFGHQPARAWAPIALVIGAVLATTPALAQRERDDPGLQLACAPDFFRLCPGVDPQSPEAERCMNRNRPRFSPDCRNAIADFDRRSAPKGSRKPDLD